MPKIVGFMALHYGKSYMASAIRSVIDYVDEMWIAYSDVGSHGTRTNIPCPDTRDELLTIAQQAAGDKLGWVDGRWSRENEQRNVIHEVVADADAIVVVDSDELYPEGLIPDLLQQTSAWHRKRIRVPFVHFYRDFRHCIIHDPSFPERLIYPQVQESSEATAQTRPIAHMGYCQPAETIRYKLEIHGHKADLRCTPDEYVDRIYLDRSRWTDLHPVGSEHWNAEPVNPFDYLPAWMQEHPFANRDVIE